MHESFSIMPRSEFCHISRTRWRIYPCKYNESASSAYSQKVWVSLCHGKKLSWANLSQDNCIWIGCCPSLVLKVCIGRLQTEVSEKVSWSGEHLANNSVLVYLATTDVTGITANVVWYYSSPNPGISKTIQCPLTWSDFRLHMSFWTAGHSVRSG